MKSVKFTLEELLPETAKAHLEAALFELITLNAPIAVAYRRLMSRLDDDGISPPSLSSFRRWAKQAQSAAARRAQRSILGLPT